MEEKRGLIEEQLKAHLFHGPRMEVFGKRDPAGELLIPAVGEVTLPIIAKAIARVLGEVPNRAFLEATAADERALAEVATTSKEARVPLFCAGCPHNTSTKVPDGSRAAAGIGCHYMAQWMDRNTWTFTHMGGEGANWIGQAPFTDEGHIFVNMGDGTFNHSGLLAIRAAVAAGVNVTYKILFNDAVAMTGGQPMDGDLTVADVVRQVLAEGVQAVRVVTDDPERHPGADYRRCHASVSMRCSGNSEPFRAARPWCTNRHAPRSCAAAASAVWPRSRTCASSSTMPCARAAATAGCSRTAWRWSRLRPRLAPSGGSIKAPATRMCRVWTVSVRRS